jgi:hypothetical protein
MDGWITCPVEDKVIICTKSVVYAKRDQQQAAAGRLLLAAT